MAESKIDKCVKFLSKADENIEYFDRQIEVSKMKFRALWNENHQIFSRIYDGTVKGYIDSNFEELLNVNLLDETGDYIIFRNEIRDIFKENAKKISIELIKSIEEKAHIEITNLKNNVIELVDFDTLSINNKLSLNGEFDYLFELPLDKNEYKNKYIELYKRKILTDSKILKEVYQRIGKSLKQKKPLDSINDKIITYKEDSTDILNLYYDAIKMYNVVAFSFEVKNYISDLGLAKEFDDLESGEINKTKYNLMAEKELLGNFKDSSDKFETELNKNINNSVKISNSLNELDLTFEFINDLSGISTEKEKESIKTNDISTLLTDAYRTLVSNIQNNLIHLSNDIKKLKRGRTRWYLSTTLGPILLFILIWFGFKYRNIETPTNLIWTVIISVGCSLVSTLIYSLTNKYKTNHYNKVDVFKTEITKENNELITGIFDEFKEKNNEKQLEIANHISQKWLDEEDNLLSELKKCEFTSIDSNIVEIKNELLVFIKNYKDSYDVFNENILSLFNNHDDSMEKIDKVASKIKEESIRPSFELLKNTIDEIKTVKKEIEILDY